MSIIELQSIILQPHPIKNFQFSSARSHICPSQSGTTVPTSLRTTIQFVCVLNIVKFVCVANIVIVAAHFANRDTTMRFGIDHDNTCMVSIAFKTEGSVTPLTKTRFSKCLSFNRKIYGAICSVNHKYVLNALLILTVIYFVHQLQSKIQALLRPEQCILGMLCTKVITTFRFGFARLPILSTMFAMPCGCTLDHFLSRH